MDEIQEHQQATTVRSTGQEGVRDDNDNDPSCSSSGASEEGSTGGGGGYVKQEEKLEVAKKEDRAVWYLRFIVFLLLGGVALMVCLLVYFGARNSEQVDFEDDFADMSEKLVDSFQRSFQLRLGIFEDFNFEITSYARDTNATWPFVTLPGYERRARRSAFLAQILSIILLPVVQQGPEREQWEEYAQEHKGWREEGIASQRGIPADEVEALPPFPPFIWESLPDQSPQPVVNRSGPFYPIWQVFPSVPIPLMNGNIHSRSAYTSAIDTIVATKKAVLPPSYDFWGLAVEDARRTLFNQYLDAYDQPVDYEDDPLLPLMLPVFDRPEEDLRELKAVTLSGVYWRTFFRGILPPGTNGIVVILENTCNQTYTYQIDGTEAKFLGHGDLHDRQYNDMETVAADFQELTQTYGTTVDGANCLYRLRVFPSQEFENDRTSNSPAVYAILLAAVFVFTSAVFLLYDYCIEKRQQAVMKSALQSGALVSSLFPEEVRQRLYEEQEANIAKRNKNEDWKSGNGPSSSKNPSDADATLYKTHAIASLYPETTIYFADLVGFTSWSSKRTPVEVFDLLEALYGEFDAIAARLKVFKVETIGDCYVAATGLPEAQPDHAVIMAKFARQCMSKIQTVKAAMAEKLGQDTMELEMRAGLHSGPVTAGVLRGQKSRFQLFGDSVNTAARMESNGRPRMIHCSQDTADCLITAGKIGWLTTREDKIVAKGKGEMQTYWVQVKGSGTPSAMTFSTISSGEEDDEDVDEKE